MNVIFKVIRDILHLQEREEEKERRRRQAALQDHEPGEPRRCPVCQEPAGEHDTECPSCGARLD